MSLSTLFASLKSMLSETESDVLAVIADIKAGLVVAETDINSALQWIASNAPTIVSDIQMVVGIAETVGVAANPEVAAAITAANEAVAALNAFAAASNSGSGNVTAVVDGYVAVKQAQAAASSAAAATISTPTAKAA